MFTAKLLPGLVVFMLLLTVGCSPLHTEIKPGYRWTEVSTVFLHEPDHDPWGLTVVVRQELQAMGYALASPGTGSRDLIVRFSTQDGPDFTSEGVLVTRPKSLHVQFVDPDTDALVAVADYFLRSSEDPAIGMKTALAGLHQRLLTSNANVPASLHKQAQTPIRPAVAEDAQPPATPTAAVPLADPGEVPALSAESERTTAIPEETPTGPAEPGITVKEAEPEIRSLERSPWVPRLKSWGFEDWGKTDDIDR